MNFKKTAKRYFNQFYAYYIYGVYRRRLLKKLYIPKEQKDIDWKEINTITSNLFEIKDENWCYIKHIHDIAFCERLGMTRIYEENECTVPRVMFIDQGIKVESCERQSNRWIFMKSKRSFGDTYAIEFDVVLDSIFTEFQFAFNYESIMNRKRFMVVDNEKLVFGTVEKGSFITLKETPMHFNIAEKNTIRIEIIKDSFYYYVNGKIIMAVQLIGKTANENQRWCLIFWESGDVRPIKATLSNFKYYTPRVLC